ncbi:hypothetical protein ACFRQM_44025 [Streptomyces sp. NPDC056831]|uniref:hypothetical protein n=1 Tax=Streptomyces sp. NPDC056831 TaxID=3345954 RepID=UPI00369F9876
MNDMLRARQEAAAAPPPEPSIISEPTYPYGFTKHRLAGTVRWSCVHGCGWAHDENPGLEVTWTRVVLPADFTGRDIDDALTAQANERHNAMRKRVEDALTDHYARAHPDRQGDDRT